MESGKEMFSLEELADCHRVHGVVMHDGVYVVDVGKRQLNSGEDRQQSEWAHYSSEAHKRNDFVVGSLPLYYSLFKTLYDHRDSETHREPVAAMRNWLERYVNTYYATLSRVYYRREGDEVIHNFGQHNQYSLKGRIGGSNGNLLTANQVDTACGLLFGSNNPKEINDVFKWLTGKDTFLQRLDCSWENVVYEEQSLFGADYDSFRLIVDGSHDRFYPEDDDYIIKRRPALGVRAKLILH